MTEESVADLVGRQKNLRQTLKELGLSYDEAWNQILDDEYRQAYIAGEVDERALKIAIATMAIMGHELNLEQLEKCCVFLWPKWRVI